MKSLQEVQAEILVRGKMIESCPKTEDEKYGGDEKNVVSSV